MTDVGNVVVTTSDEWLFLGEPLVKEEVTEIVGPGTLAVEATTCSSVTAVFTIEMYDSDSCYALGSASYYAAYLVHVNSNSAAASPVVTFTAPRTA